MSDAPNRQALFGGTEMPPDHLALDLPRLTRYLSQYLEGINEPMEAVKFKGGQSNPTYRLTTSAGSYVLRRKPPGTLLESAHDIGREYRVLKALYPLGIPVPRPYLYCDDTSIIGSEFYIVSYVPGRVFWDAELPGVAARDRTKIYDVMNAVLAQLHDLDFDAVGLGGIGRKGDYAARNLARWSKVYRHGKLMDIPDMDWLMTALADSCPQDEVTTFIHGDYGLYNMVVDPDESRLHAVLDWEMATLGDPFIDLAHHLRPWWEPPDPSGGAASSLVGRGLASLGIPDMDAYVATYCARRNLPVPDMTWYLGYAQFRYGAMIQGILKRAEEGTTSSRIILHRQERVVEIAALARSTLEQG